MELAESIKDAWAAVVESGVPEHMQELAFREALRSVLGPAPERQTRSPAATTMRPKSSEGASSTSADGDRSGVAPTLGEEQVVAAVAEYFSIPVERLEKVFHVDDGVVKLLVNPPTKLGTSTAEKTRNTAQVVTVVRKVGMAQTDTSYDIIRAECERRHHYDSKNFAANHLSTIPGFVVKGEGKGRRLEAKAAGLSAFPALIDKILGES